MKALSIKVLIGSLKAVFCGPGLDVRTLIFLTETENAVALLGQPGWGSQALTGAAVVISTIAVQTH